MPPSRWAVCASRISFINRRNRFLPFGCGARCHKRVAAIEDLLEGVRKIAVGWADFR